MRNGKKIGQPILPTPSELLAGARVLREVLISNSPLVQRCVGQALHDSNPADALAFCDKLEATLLALRVPQVRLHSHARPSPVGMRALLDPRD